MELKEEWFIEYIENANKKWSDETLRQVQIDLKQAKSFVVDGYFNEQEYIQYLNEHLKTKTILRKITTMRNFCNYLCEQDYINYNPFISITKNYTTPSSQLPTLTLSEIKEVQSIVEKRVKDAKSDAKVFTTTRDQAMIECLINTGIRSSELFQLKLENIDLESGCINIEGENERKRTLQLSSSVIQYLKHYISLLNIDNNDFIFRTRSNKPLNDLQLRKILISISKESSSLADIHLTPMMFRNTYCKLLIEKGIHPITICKVMGMKQINPQLWKTIEIDTNIKINVFE